MPFKVGDQVYWHGVGLPNFDVVQGDIAEVVAQDTAVSVILVRWRRKKCSGSALTSHFSFHFRPLEPAPNTTAEPGPRPHTCTMVEYVGITNRFHYCTICDKKER